MPILGISDGDPTRLGNACPMLGPTRFAGSPTSTSKACRMIQGRSFRAVLWAVSLGFG